VDGQPVSSIMMVVVMWMVMMVVVMMMMMWGWGELSLALFRTTAVRMLI
jgi:hypothetical protein